MKFLHTSDWHLGKSLYEIPLHGDQEEFIEWIISLLERERLDAVLLAGDIFDRPVPPAHAVQLYDHFLSNVVGRLGIPVLAIAGNHDSSTRLEFGSGFYRQAGYHIAGYPQKDPVTVTLPDAGGAVSVALIPYLHPADARSLLDNPEIKTFHAAYDALLKPFRPQGRAIAVAHGFFSSLSATGAPLELLTSDSEINVGGMDIASAGCFSRFCYTALGHLHAPQWVEEGRIRYSGTPLKYSLSEERQEKSVTLVELDNDGSVATRLIPVPQSHDVRTIRGSLSQLLDPSFHCSTAFGDYVFADVEGPEEPFPMEKLRTLFPNLLGLRFLQGAGGNGPLLLEGAGTRKLSVEELFCRFYQEMKGEEISPSQLGEIRSAIAALAEPN